MLSKLRNVLSELSDELHLWEKFSSSMSNSMPSTVVWECLRQKTSNCTYTFIPVLLVNGVTVTSQDEVTFMLSSIFELASSSASYAPAFLKLRAHEESHTLSFASGDTETYNSPFSMAELRSALKCTHGTSPGPDAIHNQMLRHLPPSILSAEHV
jgi:hypothetical protein